MKLWLDEAEKTLSCHTPLASSVDIVEQQKRNTEVEECDPPSLSSSTPLFNFVIMFRVIIVPFLLLEIVG